MKINGMFRENLLDANESMDSEENYGNFNPNLNA